MKTILSTLMMMLFVGVSAQAGSCAVAAAEGARAFAAQEWNSQESALKVEGTQQMRSSNSAPIEIYAVGIRSASGHSDLFTVALENNGGGNCKIVDVDLANFVE